MYAISFKFYPEAPKANFRLSVCAPDFAQYKEHIRTTEGGEYTVPLPDFKFGGKSYTKVNATMRTSDKFVYFGATEELTLKAKDYLRANHSDTVKEFIDLNGKEAVRKAKISATEYTRDYWAEVAKFAEGAAEMALSISFDAKQGKL